MRKILVAVASIGLVIAGALPAAAQGGVSASISGVSNGQAVQDSISITGSASAATGVQSISITWNNAALKSQSWGGVQQNQSISVGVNTNNYPNGDYTIKVTATSQGGGSNSASARVLVDNPPTAPSGLYTSHSDGVVTFGWNRNPESDVFAYRVTRNGNFLTETGDTSVTDQPGPGDHSYSVTAVRRSPTSGTKTSGATSTSINVPNPPPASNGDGTGSGSTPGYGNDANGGYGNPAANGGGKTGSRYGNTGGKGKQYGYNGGKGKNGGTAGLSGYGYYFSGGRSLAGIGLPSNLTLPGGRLTGYNPALAESVDEGTFQETLPYDLSGGEGEAELLGETGGLNIAARRTSFLIPPDGLRWVAAGLWFLVAAALLKFLERIVAKREEQAAAAAGVTSAMTESRSSEDGDRALTPKLKLIRRKQKDAA